MNWSLENTTEHRRDVHVRGRDPERGLLIYRHQVSACGFDKIKCRDILIAVVLKLPL